MTDPEYLLDGLWRTLLDTEKAVEKVAPSLVALSLLGLALDVVQGLQERRTDIRKLITDLQIIGRGE